MNAKITPSRLSGTIIAPPSKSYAHRLMIAACLSGGNRIVKNVGESKDVFATASALKSLGADCFIQNGDFTVRGFSPAKTAVVNCGESGSTLRFLIPVASALGVNATFTGTEKLLSRPCGALIDCLKSHGVSVSGFNFVGKPQGGKFVIDGGVSSQYITGLLFALPLIGSDCEIKITGERVSKPYTEITLDVMRKSGVSIRETSDGYFIAGGQKYNLSSVTETEGDWSGAAFLLTGGAIGGNVTVKGLNAKSLQGDKSILDVLRKFGATIDINSNEVTVEKPKDGKLKSINLDCENIPDLVQIISVAAAYSEGKTTLRGVKNLKYKESDRISAVTGLLSFAGIGATFDGESINIIGGEPKGFNFDSGNDHRTAMSAAILATKAIGTSKITCAEAVKKSYPAFYEDYTTLGGLCDVDI